MIRPSSLSRARVCPKSAALAEQFPEGNENTEAGNSVDAQVTAALRTMTAPTDPDALACFNYVGAIGNFIPADLHGTASMLHVQEKVALVDPESGETLSEGTPDLQMVTGDLVTTLDYKRRHQWDLGRLQGPDESDQLHTYSVARALHDGAKRYQNIIVLFADGKVEPLRSRIYEESEWWPFIEGVKALNARKPDAIVGDHCMDCYSKHHCEAWRARAATAMTVFAGGEVALTDESSSRMMLAIEDYDKARDFAMDALKAYAKGGGTIRKGDKVYQETMVKGRESADLAAIKAAGLLQYVKQGAPYSRWAFAKEKP